MTPPVVIKVGGAAAEDEHSAPALWDTVAALHGSDSGGVVLVHGGGKAVDRHLERLGIVSQRREGIRLTPPEHMDQIAAILAGVVNTRIVAALNVRGVRAVGLRLGDGRAIPAVKTTRYAFDPGCVGEVVTDGTHEPGLLELLLANRYLPVLSSIGMDDRGGLLNVNADDAAAGVARRLGARALVLLTDVPGVMDGSRRPLPEITPAGIEALIESGAITGGMIVKVRAAADAARRIGAPVVILSGNDPSSLAEWASGRPVGTRVLPR
jgi:acetylglutamate kinase